MNRFDATMRIRTRMLSTLAVATAVVLLITTSLVQVTLRGQYLQDAQEDAREVGRDVSSLQTLTQEFTLYGEARPAQQWHARLDSLRETLQHAIESADEDPGLPALLLIRDRVDELALAFAELESAQATPDATLGERRRSLLVERLTSQTQELVELRYEWARAVGASALANQARLTTIVPAGLLLLLAVCGLLAWTVLHHVLRPLARLQAVARAIQAGELTARVGSTAADELGLASRAVDDMAQSLVDAQQHLRGLMDASPLGVFTTDLAGLCTYANPTLCRIVGRGADAVLGTGLRQALHPEDVERVIALRERVKDGPGPHFSEHRMVRPDGQVRWVRAHVTLTRPAGGPGTYIGIVEDIEERRQVDQALAARTAELARSNEDLERFAYVVSHDLQEPLRMVSSYGQLLRKRHQARMEAEASEFLDFMIDGGQRALAMVRDLLSLARLDSHARPPGRVDLQAVLADTLAQLRVSLEASGARITADPLPTLAGDRIQLGQLFANLIGNALKFRRAETPTLHIGVQRENGRWRLSFRDNGIGIEPAYFDRIFVMFQRLHLRSEHPGTGIGLAICKRVAERHGGTITVESEPGHGTTFHVTLADPGQAGGTLPEVAAATSP